MQIINTFLVFAGLLVVIYGLMLDPAGAIQQATQAIYVLIGVIMVIGGFIIYMLVDLRSSLENVSSQGVSAND